jgi:copper oxidase (laccase) domain-containing protein
VGNPERYFSYRRDQQRLGASGRMCAYIWLRD